MADTVSKRKRSEIMSHVRSKGSKMEKLLHKEFSKRGFKYLKNSRKYFGKPDLTLPKHKTAIFVDSCFWHGCKGHCRIPTANKKYWLQKIERNKQRDKKVNRFYKKINWRVIRIWEHDIGPEINMSKLFRIF